MKYRITYRDYTGLDESQVVEAGTVEVRAGRLYLISKTDTDEKVHAIFDEWKKVVELKE